MFRASSIGLFLALGAGLVGACSGDTEPTGNGGSGGSGGSGGGGAGGTTHAWDKPVCPDPGMPLGGVPDPRKGTAGAINADATQLVIFAGDTAKPMCPDIPPRQYVGDTWLLDTACGAWTQLTIPGPPDRANHAMTEDASRNRALMFGGRWHDESHLGVDTMYDDVWAFDWASQKWSEIVTTGTGPSARDNTAMIVAGDQLIVFGGNTSDWFDLILSDQTFALDLSSNEWRQIALTDAPPARFLHHIAYDPDTNRVFIGTGSDKYNYAYGPYFDDYWVLDVAAEQWHEIPTIAAFAKSELQRTDGGMVFRPAGDDGPAGLVTFGGDDIFSVRNDARFLDLTGLDTLPPAGPMPWSDLRLGDVFDQPITGDDICDLPPNFVVTDMEAPERRHNFALGNALGGGAMVIFAGSASCGRLNDAWWLDTGTGDWTAIRESPAGLSCPRTGNPDCEHLCF